MGKIYYQTNGDNWDYCGVQSEDCVPQDNSQDGLDLSGDSWLSGSDVCDWAFINCDLEDCVTHIEVDTNRVTGTLINEIDQLEKLQVFTMDGDPNELTGTIPTQFGNLPELRLLDLDENGLTGSIPEELYNAIKLTTIDLDTNDLTGTISASLSKLVNLDTLQLNNNPISGPFPNEQLAQLQQLVTVSLFSMDITGVVSQEVCDLRDLNLNVLWTDCGGQLPQVVCDCCDFCFT